TLVDGSGKEHTINVRANGDKLELGAIGEIELQAGDRLWFRANSSGVTNGTLATLAGTDEQGRLVTTDGFVLPEDYLKLAHGYATTSHSSQGLTANFAVVFGAAFDQKAIYVSHSRARERVDTYVPSKEAFLARAERAQGERLGVLEAMADARKKNGSSPPNGGVKVGDKINWSYEPRGGYGYTQQIAGVVTKLGREKIQIRVAKRDNGSWVAAERWVVPDKLSGRVSRATPEEAAQLMEPETKSMDKIAEVAAEKKTKMKYAEIVSKNGSHYVVVDGQEYSRHDSVEIAEKVRNELINAELQRQGQERESKGTDGHRRGLSQTGGNGNLVSADEAVGEKRQYLTVPYAEREAAKAAGAKWDWREKLWYIGPEGTRQGLAKWLPENAAAAAPARANPREEFAEVLRDLGGDLTGAHPIMDGRTHRMATLDDDRGEKSLFYVAHSDGRPAGYAKNNRTGEEQRWKASAVTMTKEQFTTIAAPDKLAEREADRAATWEKTAERLRAQLETYPDLSPDHDYLKAKRISLQAGAFETARGSMAIPAFDADGKLWSVQYVNSDGSKRFARDSRKEGCFHVVGAPYSQNLLSTGADGVTRHRPIADLRQAKALVIAEGYATAATLKELYNTPSDGEREQLKGDQTEIYRGVQFIAAFDAGNLPHVASALRERYPDKVIVIAADNYVSLAQGQGRNPGLINGQKAAGAIHAELMVPRFSDEEIQAGMTDFNDLTSHDEVRKGLVAQELEQALAKAFALKEVLARSQQVEAAPAPAQSSAETEHEEETPDQNISSGVDAGNNTDQAKEEA